MKLNIRELNKLAKNIAKNAGLAPKYNTGLADEHIIIGAYQTMELERLVKIRHIMNHIIHAKKLELAKKIGFPAYKSLVARWEQDLK